MVQEKLILIPGTLNDEQLWCEQISSLSDIAECIVPDITKAETMEEMAKAVFDAAPSGPLNVVGFSLGGFVAQEMLRQNMKRIKRLALLGTDYLPDNEEQALQRKNVVDMAHLPGKFIGIGNQMLKSYLSPGHWADTSMTKRVQNMTQRLGAEVLIRQNSIDRKDGTKVLQQYRGPVLIMCGAQDRIRPPEISVNMSKLMPQSRMIIVEGAGHLLPIEAPSIVNSEIMKWLNVMPTTLLEKEIPDKQNKY